MSHISKTTNRLLANLPQTVLDALDAKFEEIELPVRMDLTRSGTPQPYAYFLDSGIASVVIGPEEIAGVEVGIVGREGFVGAAILLGVGQCPHHTFMQVAGRGWRIAARDLSEALAVHPELGTRLYRYLHCYMVQISTTAYANADYSVEERLARWLLLCIDRMDSDDVHLTHEFLSVMLGVRRPGVTVATHILEGKGMIKATRGLLKVLDRTKLEQLAGNSYGIAEAEYERVFGRPDAPQAGSFAPANGSPTLGQTGTVRLAQGIAPSSAPLASGTDR